MSKNPVLHLRPETNNRLVGALTVFFEMTSKHSFHVRNPELVASLRLAFATVDPDSPQFVPLSEDASHLLFALDHILKENLDLEETLEKSDLSAVLGLIMEALNPEPQRARRAESEEEPGTQMRNPIRKGDGPPLGGYDSGYKGY